MARACGAMLEISRSFDVIPPNTARTGREAQTNEWRTGHHKPGNDDRLAKGQLVSNLWSELTATLGIQSIPRSLRLVDNLIRRTATRMDGVALTQQSIRCAC